MEPILVERFSGAIPLYDKRILPANVATKAINCKYERGVLEPIRAPSINANLDSTTKRVLFVEDTPFQFSVEDTDVTQNPVVDAANRFYFADGIQCKKSSTDAWPTTYDLGMPTPVNPLTLAGDRLNSGTLIVGSVAYYYTYVTAWGEESAPSPATGVVEVYDTFEVILSNMSIPAYPNQNITKKRIYRLNAGNTGAEFQFLAEVDVAAAGYTDTTDAANLGDVCQTEAWIAPPAGLKGLTYMGNGYMAGFVGNDVYISALWAPYAFPISHIFSVPDPIVGLAHFDQALVVLTDGRPVVLSGIDPLSMTQTNLPDFFPCVSKASIAVGNKAVFYASVNGLVILSAQGVYLSTERLYHEDDWKALLPTTITGTYFRGKYYGFFKGTSKGFIIDYTSVNDELGITVTELDLGGIYAVKHATINPDDGEMYITVGDGATVKLLKYEGAVTKLNSEWHSKSFYNGNGSNIGVAKVECQGSCIIEVSSDGEERLLPGSSIVRTKGGEKFSDISFVLSEMTKVNGVYLASNMRDLKAIMGG